MKNILIAGLVLLLLVVGAGGTYYWNKYIREVPIEVNNEVVEKVEDKDVQVKKETVSVDIDTNLKEIESEIESIDVEKELADFNDVSW
jgi:uncharacterized protein YxeA